MVKELELEVLAIFQHIAKGENFLLSGGAGSGKTYSLVQVIKKAIEDNPTSRIACMTYTNAAVKEIEERVNHNNLNVTTIHDFLWDNIKSFQKELKKQLIILINDENSNIKAPEGVVEENYFDNLSEGIQYKEWASIKEGIISHEEVIELAEAMFKHYKTLCDVLKDKFRFIFIDEYQDTHALVVEILLIHLAQSKKRNIIGFFGDSMQAIYDDVVGDLNKYLQTGIVKEIVKTQNRRNPDLVIKLANRLRTDGLEQKPSEDLNAPNMLNGLIKKGNIKFIHSTSNDLEVLKKTLAWDFSNAKATKELSLTHNLIAPKAGFGDLMEIYDRDKILEFKKRVTDHIKENVITTDFSTSTFGQVIDELGVAPTAGQLAFMVDNPALYEEAKNYPFEIFKKIYANKDALIDDKKKDESDENKKGSKRDNLIKHLFKIQSNVHLYKEKQYNEFLRRTEYKIYSIQDKKDLKEYITTLDSMSESTIEEVIEFADEKGICIKDDKLFRFISEKEYIYNRVKQVKFKQFQKLFYYLEGYTPFSTQHKIKGTEFENVLVILDNGGWNNYNFQYLMDDSVYNTLTPAKKRSHPGILLRTKKIFYVCCTRAKENLVVFYHNPNEHIIAKAQEWFGVENVYPA